MSCKTYRVLSFICLVISIVSFALGSPARSLNTCVEETAKATDIPQSIIFSILRYERDPYDKGPEATKTLRGCAQAKYIGTVLKQDLDKGLSMRKAVDNFGGHNRVFTDNVMNEAKEFNYKY
jgi:hypothetical protein